MFGVLSYENICDQAAEEGFSAVYCCAAVEADEAGEGIRTLLLLVRTYIPGGRLVDAFYPVSNQAYHAAERLAQRLHEHSGMRFVRLSHVRLKPLCNRLPEFGRGMNTLNYLPEVGSRFCLELLGTDAGIAMEDRTSPPSLQCASCRRCMHACPTGAITEGSFDRTKCIRNYMLNGKIMPEAYRHYIGTDGGAKGILGCDICQRVCPINAPIEEQRQDAEAFTLHELLTCNKETLTRFAALYGRNYAIRNRIVAQAVLAAANQQDERQTRVITELQRSLSPAIQEHAIWAIRETTKNVK